MENGSDKTNLAITSTDGEFEIYTRKGDIPTISFHDWFVKATRSEFIVDSENSGEYIALFNPDLENSIGKFINFDHFISSEKFYF